MNQPELARPARRSRTRQQARADEYATSDRVTTARVTVAWTPSNRDRGVGFASIELELVASPESAPKDRTWSSPQAFGSNWLETIAAARCSEVLLTARLGNDIPAKHLVLELAERLSLTLTDSQPLIRVRFLSTANAPGIAPHHA